MPKRTNEFQELIATVYKQIVQDGVKVTESGMVFDKDAKTLREVDILVECQIARHNFKLVIECRDRSRKESVEWIDEIIGKVGSLDVEKIVAVSKMGFAKAAVRKAQAHNIDTLTIEEAKEIDWDKYMIKPAVVVFTDDNYHLKDVLYDDGEKYASLTEMGLENVILKDGVELGTIKAVFEIFFNKLMLPNIKKRIQDDFTVIFKTREDLSKPLYQEIDYVFDGFKVRLFDGHLVDISKLKFIVHSFRSVADLNQEHIKFNEMMVSYAKHVDIDGSQLNFTVTQDPINKQIHCAWKRKNSEDA